MPDNLHRSATVRKFYAYERSESPGYENWVRTKYSGFTVPVFVCDAIGKSGFLKKKSQNGR